jgi:hypothetical protein
VRNDVPDRAELEPDRQREAETTADRLKERLYAAITMIAVVVGLSETAVGPGAAAWTIAITALGLWLASFIADQQAHRMVHLNFASGDQLRHMLYVSSPLLFSAVGPMVLLALAALGTMSVHTALWTAAGVDVTDLFVLGYLGGVRMGGGLLLALLAGGADATIGVGVALVKVAAKH